MHACACVGQSDSAWVQMSRRLQLHGRLGGIADGDEKLLATVSHYDVRAKIAIGEYRLRIK